MACDMWYNCKWMFKLGKQEELTAVIFSQASPHADQIMTKWVSNHFTSRACSPAAQAILHSGLQCSYIRSYSYQMLSQYNVHQVDTFISPWRYTLKYMFIQSVKSISMDNSCCTEMWVYRICVIGTNGVFKQQFSWFATT